LNWRILEKIKERNLQEHLFKLFTEKVRTVYEPAFIEYQKTMNDKNMNCRYEMIGNGIIFRYAFVLIPSPPFYGICFDNSKLEPFTHRSLYPLEIRKNDKQNNRKNIQIEQFSKNDIINDLTEITKLIQAEMKNKYRFWKYLGEER